MDFSDNPSDNPKPSDTAKRSTPGKRAAVTMEFLYDTTLITAAVFVFALFLSATI